MANAARSIALGLALGGISSNTGAYAAGPRLRTPSFVKTADERASKACGLRITLASQPAGIGRDCGGAGCEALPRASRFKDATVGIFGGPTHDIFDASSWREIFDVDCVDGGRILHVTFDPVEGHSLVCELGPVENISSVQDKVCSGPDGAHFYYTVEHVETFPPKDTGVDRVNPQLAPRLLQTGNDSTASPTTTDTTSSTDDASDETDAPAAQPTLSPTPEADSTPSPETPTPAPSVVATLEPTTTEPTAEPTTVVSTLEPTTVEPTAEPTTVEPTAEPTTVEPTAEPTTVEPTAEPTTVEPTAEPTTVEPIAEPTPKQTSVPETEAPNPEPTTAPVASTPTPTAEATSEPTSPPFGMTPAPSNVENTPTPTMLPSPEPSTPEPSRIIVLTSQPTVPTPQPATLEATPTPSGTTSAPASTPTVTPSTGTPVSSPQAGPTVQPTSLSTTAGPVAVTPSPTDLRPTPTSVFTTPAPSSLEECRDECSDIDTGSTWTGNYYDSSCSTNTTQGGCGLNGDDENCRRCVINRANFAVSSSSAGADEWPDCLCCVAADAGVESDLEDCENVTPSPTSSLETIILSEDELDLMMLTGAFDGDNCEANGIAIIDDTVMSITSFSDSNGNCTDSFDMLYGTTECNSDTNYNWTYNSNEYEYSYECPDPDTASSARFRRRRLSESEEAVTISSENVLCNNGDVFYSVSRAEEDESVAIVYANTKADGFEDATGDVESAASGGDYCDDVSAAITAALVAGVDTLIDDAGGGTGSGTDTTLIAIIVSVVALVVLLSLCACYCCYRSRKGKEGRADQMRRNLGFTPDMDRKGEGNFGPTNKHVAITRGGGAQMTSEMLATKTYQPGTGQHHRAPSEAPSSIIEDNIANNYRPKKAAQNWEKRKEHKSTKPAPQQHVIGAGPTSEELKVEDNMPATSVRSEQLSEHSLTQHDISSARQSGSHPSVAQTQYSYAFNDVEMDPAEEEEEEDDDDARSAATGMSGPSKYAPSGYAPSSHQEGVTHDLMSQYEPSVYEADSQYDPSLYGRESEFGEESSAYSYGPSSRNGAYGQGGNYAGRGRQAVPHGPSARASVADTAAMSHLGSVMEMDDGGETNSAYAPSDSYVSSYLSSEDDEIGRGRPTRGHHHLADSRTPPGGYGSRHNVYRSGREAVNAGRGGFGGGGGSSIEASSRHSGGRSGFEVDSRDYDEEDSDMHHMPAAMDDMEYQDSRITTSSQGAPLTGVDDRNGRRW